MSLKIQIKTDPLSIVPEKEKEHKQSIRRISAALEFFNQHFDEDGNSITPRGELLSQKYKEVTLFDTKKLRELSRER